MFKCKLKHSNGNSIDLTDYHNQVLLSVNFASLCEHTQQYAQLSQSIAALKDESFTILAFPCNQFANQEPAPIAEILDFCISKFNINFPLFDKVEVND
jgi:glutathione peroxidase